jgi:hypothetical protein
VERPPLRGLRLRETRAIERALSFERAERFADAGAFLRALQGIPVIQQGLSVAVGILLLAAGGLWYRNYLDSLPQPWEQLPARARQEFLAKIRAGKEDLEYIEQTRDVSVSQDAAKNFDDALRLHPRDPQAMRGLEAAAGCAIDWFGRLPDRTEALRQLRLFQEKSSYYKTYAPMRQAIRAAGGD